MAPQSPEMAHVEFGGARLPHGGHQQHGHGHHQSPGLVHHQSPVLQQVSMTHHSPTVHHVNMAHQPSPALHHMNVVHQSPVLQHVTVTSHQSPLLLHHNFSNPQSPVFQHHSSPLLQHHNPHSPLVLHSQQGHGSPAAQQQQHIMSPSRAPPASSSGGTGHTLGHFASPLNKQKQNNSPLLSTSHNSPMTGSSRAPEPQTSPHPDLRLNLTSLHGPSPLEQQSQLQQSLQGPSPLQHGSPQLRKVTSPDSPQLNGNKEKSNRIKCVFIGDGAVGKTSLIISYTTDSYPDEYVPTAIDTYKAVVHVDGEAVTFEMCDTAGQDDFDTLRPLVYPNVDVFVLCFSVVAPSSFTNIKEKWVPEIRGSCGKVPVVLVGTQSDLREDAKTLVQLSQYKEHPVPEADAKKLAASIGCIAYVESSSLTQKNLKDVFDYAIMAGLKYRNKKEAKGKKKARKKVCTIL